MLRIHNGLRKWIKRNVYDLHLKKTNSFDIRVPCNNIGKSKLLFEKYRMDLNRDKYDIEFRNYDAIKRNQILSDFMQRNFNRIDGLYLRERFIFIDVIIKDQLRKQSPAEIEKLNR